MLPDPREGSEADLEKGANVAEYMHRGLKHDKSQPWHIFAAFSIILYGMVIPLVKRAYLVPR